MSFIAKIFIVINLLLAALFCGFSLSLYARRVDYKAKWRDTQRELDKTERKLQEKVDNLDAKLTEKDRELTQVSTRYKNSQSELDRSLNEIEDLNGRLLDKEKMNQKLISLSKMKDEELQRLYTRIEEMHVTIIKQQQALEVAQRRERIAENRRIEMEDELNDSRHQLAQLRKEKARLEKDLAHESWVIQTLLDHNVPVNEIVYGGVVQPTRPIKTKVMGVNVEVDLVLLGAGADDGVKPGYQFIVYRGQKYIGKVEIEKVLPKLSSARILVDRLAKDDQGRTVGIREGDDASTGVY